MPVLQPNVDLTRSKSANEQEELRPFINFLLKIGAEYIRWLPDNGPYIDEGMLIAWFPDNRRIIYSGVFVKGWKSPH